MYESSTSSDSALEPFQRQEHMTMMSSCTLAVELLQLLILWANSANSAKCLHSNNMAVCPFIPFRLWGNLSVSREKREQLTQKFGSRVNF